MFDKWLFDKWLFDKWLFDKWLFDKLLFDRSKWFLANQTIRAKRQPVGRP
jgi:hypothetical protein